MRYAWLTVTALGACGPDRPEVLAGASLNLTAASMPARAHLDLRAVGAPFAEAPRVASPPGAFLFAPDALHRIDLEVDTDALRALAREPRTDVLATVRIAERRWEVALRLKGSHSFRDLDGKPSFKLDFGEFVEGQTLDGLRRLTLNNMVQDATMTREHVVYQAYAEAGVPSPRHGYAEVWLNDAPYGLYSVLDAMDATYAAWAFPEDPAGWLYEGGGGADLLVDRFERFVVQAPGVGVPHADLAGLVAELDAAGDVMDVLDARFDPSVFRMWATDIAAGHRDGYVRRRNNYLLFHGDATDRWSIVPWGNYQAFRADEGHPYDGFFGRLLVDCARSERCMDRLDAAVHEVADTWEAVGLVAFADATAAHVRDACARDPRREFTCDTDGVGAFVDARPDHLRRAVGDVRSR